MRTPAQRDLFGKKIDAKRPAMTQWLERHDKRTFDRRRARAQTLSAMYPKNYGFLMPPESHYAMNEAGLAYLNGLDVAAVMLAQAFIEHRLQIHMQSKGEEAMASKGLAAILKQMAATEPHNTYLVRKIDALRRFRNPFTHLRDFDDPDNLMQHVRRRHMPPEDVLQSEAEKALALMYTMATATL